MAGGGVVADTCLTFNRRSRPLMKILKTPSCLFDYMKLLKNYGWKITHLIDCSLSTQRFFGNMVNRMQRKRTLGIVRKYN
jgi:hypothetical protein